MNTKRFLNTLLALMVLATTLGTVGCSKDESGGVTGVPSHEDDDTVVLETAITGTVFLEPGVNANLANARVAVYVSKEDYLNDVWVAQTSMSRSGDNSFSFKISPLNPGTYYLDIWKDINSNGIIDGPDVYGTYLNRDGYLQPIQVIANQTTSISFTYAVNKTGAAKGGF